MKQADIFAPTPEETKLLHSSINFDATDKPGAIISIRGAGGSGKSNLVRRLMSICNSCDAVYLEGRKSPYYYFISSLSSELRELRYVNFVSIGSYETPTGGCDTIHDKSEIYRLVKAHALAGRNVVFEGKIAQDIKQTTELGLTVHIIYIDVTLQTCRESIAARRASAGAKPRDLRNVESNFNGNHTSIAKSRLIPGATVYVLDRESAFQKARAILGL